MSKRSSSGKLLFYDLHGEGAKIQIIAGAQNAQDLQGEALDLDAFARLHTSIKRGDIVGVAGYPGQAQCTVRCTQSCLVEKRPSQRQTLAVVQNSIVCVGTSTRFVVLGCFKHLAAPFSCRQEQQGGAEHLRGSDPGAVALPAHDALSVHRAQRPGENKATGTHGTG